MREEWRLLFLLEDADTLDSLQLTQRTTLDRVQVSRATSRLEKKGLITRSILGSDRRLRNDAITDAGRRLFNRAVVEIEARATEILDVMTEEDRQALFRGIAALDQAIASVTHPEAGHAAPPPRPVGAASE